MLGVRRHQRRDAHPARDLDDAALRRNPCSRRQGRPARKLFKKLVQPRRERGKNSKKAQKVPCTWQAGGVGDPMARLLVPALPCEASWISRYAALPLF